MSIYYNIVTKERRRSPTRYACFGLLNQLGQHYDGNVNRHSPFFNPELGQRALSQSVGRSARNVTAIEFSYKETLLEEHYEATAARIIPIYIEYVKNLVENFKIFRDCVSIRENLNVIRVSTVGHPSDKIMFCLSVIRNVLKWVVKYHSNTQFESSALGMVQERIPDFKQRMIFLWIFDIYKNNAFASRPNTLGLKPAFSSEYSLLNPATFGKQALRKLMNDEDSIEWFQPLFQDTVNGYLRDHHFSCDNIAFPGADLSTFRGRYHQTNPRQYDEQRYPTNAHIGPYLFRRLFDSLSVEADEPLFDFCTWDDTVGFMWIPHIASTNTFDEEEIISQYLALFEEN